MLSSSKKNVPYSAVGKWDAHTQPRVAAAVEASQQGPDVCDLKNKIQSFFMPFFGHKHQ